MAALRSASAAAFWDSRSKSRVRGWDESGGKNVPRHVELLVDDGFDPVRISQLDERAHLGAEYPALQAKGEELVEIGDRLHDLYAVGQRGKAPIDLQERHDVLRVPKVIGKRQTADLAVEGVLEEDGA